MNPQTIIDALKNALALARELAAAGKDVGPILTDAYNIAVKGKKATQAELDALKAKSDKWSEELMAPLPPE